MMSLMIQWRMYLPRIAWIVTLALLGLAMPHWYLNAAGIYLGFVGMSFLFAVLGVDTTLWWQIRHKAPVPRQAIWVTLAFGGAGLAAVASGVVTGVHAFAELGLLSIFVGVDFALWSREVRCRHGLTARGLPPRSRSAR